MVDFITVTGEQLQNWRESHGLSREELARELKTSYPTVYRWEEGQRKIPPYLELALRTIETDLRDKDSALKP